MSKQERSSGSTRGSALDQALETMRRQRLSDTQAEESGARVWQKVMAESASPQGRRAPPGPCQDFEGLLASYHQKTLTPDQHLLLQDHLASCLSCRRALKTERRGEPETLPVPIRTSSLGYRLLFGLAALFMLVLGATVLLPRVLQTPVTGPVAQVSSIRGTLLGDVSLEGGRHGFQPLQAGHALLAAASVRTTQGSSAVLTLEDGSSIELDERSSLSITGTSRGMTLNLERGRIMVEAAKQRSGHLFVRTHDALTSVVGTIFSVYSGLKGTRVSVVEGEVHVTTQGVEHVLVPGEQVSSSSSLGWVALSEELSWSQKLEAYRGMLEARAQAESGESGGFEHQISSRFVGIQPPETALYLGIPLQDSALGDSGLTLLEAITLNPLLARWWEEAAAQTAVEEQLQALLDWVVAVQESLGDEASLSIQVDEAGAPEGLLIVADVADPEALQGLLDEERPTLGMLEWTPEVIRVDDPGQLEPDLGPGLYVWQGADQVVVSTSPQHLKTAAGALSQGEGTAFGGSGFGTRLTLGLDAGTSWLLGADLGLVLNGAVSWMPDQASLLGELGILDMDYFLADGRTVGDITTVGASLTFDQTRRGLAAILAEPAPMGSLDLVTSGASFVSAWVVRSPAEALGELFSILERNRPGFQAELLRIEAAHGVQVVQDLAAPLGQEVLFALDGPILPTLSWKLVFEVEDQARLQSTLSLLLGQLAGSAEAGTCAGVTTRQSVYAGVPLFEVGSAEACVHVAYAFVDGYWIVVPGLGLLQRTLDQVQGGLSLSGSRELRERLPLDGHSDLSGLFYQNVGALVGELSGELVGALSQDDAQEMQTLLEAAQSPSLLAVYAEPEQVLMASSEDARAASGRIAALTQLVSFVGALASEGASGR